MHQSPQNDNENFSDMVDRILRIGTPQEKNEVIKIMALSINDIYSVLESQQQSNAAHDQLLNTLLNLLMQTRG